MSRNIEIKARVERLDELEARAASIADEGPIAIAQDDTFFACPNGRLKLRAFSANKGELIFYRRADAAGPKESYYLITPTAASDELRATLSEAYGQIGRVRKQRTLYLAGATRIHLDRVEGLGDFMELEVVLGEGQTAEQGIEIAHELMARLGISGDQLVEGAYLDLMRAG
ncbi:class IV adenylate cyclase [Noviherbaspirillum malthae]|jgi:predicted adenylyl cyclase CyaB|uniref:class IV adenylate cyclase n=1 Tax=Noviherbaspirillum malthae TaxID=1260987 RepID=UPI00188FB51A|nr:class IV adenylate cyclase [Noviherbaspirillum malthae]